MSVSLCTSSWTSYNKESSLTYGLDTFPFRTLVIELTYVRWLWVVIIIVVVVVVFIIGVTMVAICLGCGYNTWDTSWHLFLQNEMRIPLWRDQCINDAGDIPSDSRAIYGCWQTLEEGLIQRIKVMNTNWEQQEHDMIAETIYWCALSFCHW